MDLYEQLTGPMGGMIALAFGMGAASGYAFALKTTLAAARERIGELKEELRSLHDELKTERQRYLVALEKASK